MIEKNEKVDWWLIVFIFIAGMIAGGSLFDALDNRTKMTKEDIINNCAKR